MTVGKRAGPDDSEDLRDLGHLAAAVSHSVINAFSAVVSNAELVRSHARDANGDPAELTALGAAIIENALNAAQIPRRLIDWTRRFTAPGPVPGAAPPLIELNEVVRSTVSACSSVFGPSINWSLNLGPVPMVRGNAEQLGAMLEHLIANAREAMPGGLGTIAFTTRAAARNWVVLEVRDTGSGMDNDVLKHAAEPFFTTKPGRSGTGLTIAHGIWRRHHGTLAIESQPGQGTLVRLSIEAPSPSPSPQQGPAPGRFASRPAEPPRADGKAPSATSATAAGMAAAAVADMALAGIAVTGEAHGALETTPENQPANDEARENAKVPRGPGLDAILNTDGVAAPGVEALFDAENEIPARPVSEDG